MIISAFHDWDIIKDPCYTWLDEHTSRRAFIGFLIIFLMEKHGGYTDNVVKSILRYPSELLSE